MKLLDHESIAIFLIRKKRAAHGIGHRCAVAEGLFILTSAGMSPFQAEFQLTKILFTNLLKPGSSLRYDLLQDSAMYIPYRLKHSKTFETSLPYGKILEQGCDMAIPWLPSSGLVVPD